MIDTTFDFRSDSGGKDPDAWSPTLRRYHQFLWSKPLPDGHDFALDTDTPGEYLHHKSDLGEFFCSSDSVIATYEYWERTKHFISEIPRPDVDEFVYRGYTMGGMLIFPSNRVEGQWTINMTRGMKTEIADRLDLTLECIRRHYLGLPSPLDDVLARYGNFFGLFGDFAGYTTFFLLQDLLDGAGGVDFFLPFDGFRVPAYPDSAPDYQHYRERSLAFIDARNRRIDAWQRSVDAS